MNVIDYTAAEYLNTNRLANMLLKQQKLIQNLNFAKNILGLEKWIGGRVCTWDPGSIHISKTKSQQNQKLLPHQLIVFYNCKSHCMLKMNEFQCPDGSIFR